MATLDDFISLLQGASNAAASNLSAPVDGINWVLKKAGLPVSEKPVGGSEWLRQIGFTAEPKNANMGLLGEAVGGVLPMVAAAKAPQIAAKLNQAGQNLAAPRTLNPQTGAIVWHGSPHKFDNFDSSKIGTGEGAQAYGHGLYLAESPDVAGQYQRNLGGVEMRDKAGKVVPIPENVEWVAKDLAAAGGDYNKVRSQLAEHGKMYPWPAEVGTKYINELEAAGIKPADLGSLYKVDLPDEHIAKMLDWDKPLSQQAPEVRRGLQELGEIVGGKDWQHAMKTDDTGSWFYRLLDDAYKNSPRGGAVDASTDLRTVGIPGIRYLDGGSRGAGQGTSNFVIFPGNEGLLSILERNGQPLR